MHRRHINPDQWMEPKDQRKSTISSSSQCVRARQALDDANWHPSTEEDRCATGTMIGSGIGGLSGMPMRRCFSRSAAAQDIAILHSGRLINLARVYVSIEQGLRVPTCGGHRLFDRRSRDRRCGPADRAACRRDGGWRNGITDLPAIDGRILRVSRGYRPASTIPRKASRPYDRIATVL